MYVGHDYHGRTCSTIGEEKAHNPRLAAGLEGFVALMRELNLPLPRQINRAVPANCEDGARFPYA